MALARIAMKQLQKQGIDIDIVPEKESPQTVAEWLDE